LITSSNKLPGTFPFCPEVVVPLPYQYLYLLPFLGSSAWSPPQNITPKNVVNIVKGLGNLLEVENCEVSGLIYRHHLRITVELEIRKFLVPGFHFSRVGKPHIWVQFKYDRLADYCILCGLVGLSKILVLLLKYQTTECYGFSLKATSFSSPRTSLIIKDGPREHEEVPTNLPAEAQTAHAHGDESTELQLLPFESQSQIVPAPTISSHVDSTNPADVTLAPHAVLAPSSHQISSSSCGLPHAMCHTPALSQEPYELSFKKPCFVGQCWVVIMLR
jgi:hypothetical protein